jgi:hypothetical protein
VRSQVFAEQGLVERLAVFGTGMRVRVGQPGKQPALPRQLGAGHRVIGPPVTIGVQVDGISVGKGKSADPEDGHQTTVTTPATTGEQHVARLAGA